MKSKYSSTSSRHNSKGGKEAFAGSWVERPVGFAVNFLRPADGGLEMRFKFEGALMDCG